MSNVGVWSSARAAQELRDHLCGVPRVACAVLLAVCLQPLTTGGWVASRKRREMLGEFAAALSVEDERDAALGIRCDLNNAERMAWVRRLNLLSDHLDDVRHRCRGVGQALCTYLCQSILAGTGLWPGTEADARAYLIAYLDGYLKKEEEA